MHTVQTAYQAALELADVLKRIDTAQVAQFASFIKNGKRIFVTGAGRSLLMLRGFAMRLMHIGYEVYVVGDVTTPAFLKDDVLVVASASGETASLIATAQKAGQLGGRIIALSVFEQSSLARLAQAVVKIPAYTDKLPASEFNKKGILPGGSMFEEAVLLLTDSLILDLAHEHRIDTDKAFEKHANLE